MDYQAAQSFPWDILLHYDSIRPCLSRRVLRLVCKDARNEVDRNHVHLALRGGRGALPKENSDSETFLEPPPGDAPPMARVVRFTKSVVQRGCMPKSVAIELIQGAPEERRCWSILILQALHGSGARTQSLVLQSDALDPASAAMIAATFPALEHLGIQLTSDSRRHLADTVLGLEALMGLGGDSCGGGAGGSGLEGLTSLEVTRKGVGRVPAGLVASLPKLHRLRKLQLLRPFPDKHAAYLGELTQLGHLALTLPGHCCSGISEQLPLLTQLIDLAISADDKRRYSCGCGPPVCRHEIRRRVAVPQLSALTRLVFDEPSFLAVPANTLTALTNLRQLTIVDNLDLQRPPGCLASLSALTSLTVGSFVEKAAPPTRRAPNRQPPSWQLPPRLMELAITGKRSCAYVLSGLQLPSGLEVFTVLNDFFQLDLSYDHFTGPYGCLLAAGEAALCRALRLLARSQKQVKDLTICYEDGRQLVGFGGGRSHTVWLGELAALPLKQLRLEGTMLTDVDAQVISQRLTTLEELELKCCFGRNHTPAFERHLSAVEGLNVVVEDTDSDEWSRGDSSEDREAWSEGGHMSDESNEGGDGDDSENNGDGDET